MKIDIILIIILISLNLFSFGIGYLIGKIGSIHGVSHIKEQKSFFDKEKKTNNHNILIDTTKVVTNISTEGLEKKYDGIAPSKHSDENISSSINKLKNMKG